MPDGDMKVGVTVAYTLISDHPRVVDWGLTPEEASNRVLALLLGPWGGDVAYIEVVPAVKPEPLYPGPGGVQQST